MAIKGQLYAIICPLILNGIRMNKKGKTAQFPPYILNNYNFRKFKGEKFLVTTEHGSWALLSKKDFDLLRLAKAEENPKLFKELGEKGIILTEGNAQKAVRAYRERNHFLFQGPSLHIITPTLRCNQRCIYCHSRAEPDSSAGFDMDKDTAKATVDFILGSPAKSLVIEFQGGDCLLNYGIVEYVIDYAGEVAEKKGKKVSFSLVSNLTKMDETILASLKKRHILGIATSLDGPKQVHDKNRKYLGGEGSYDDVVYWIKRIKTEFKNDFNLNALSTITRYSLPYGKEIVDEYMKLGFDGVWLRFLNNLGFAADAWEKIGYSPAEYLSFYEKTLDYIVKKNEKKDFSEMFSVIFLKKILTGRDPMFVDVQSPCGAAIGQLLYKYNGDIHTCDEGKILEEFKLGNVKENRHADLFRGKTVASLVDISSKKNYLCDACVWNPYCGICPIYSLATQGSIVSKIAMDDRCKTFDSMLEKIFERLLYSEKHEKTFKRWIEKDTVFG
jgi:uncharacterized protein